MDEYGIFNDEGLIEGDFWSEASARVVAARDYEADDVTVMCICPSHREQAKEWCEECSSDEAA